MLYVCICLINNNLFGSHNKFVIININYFATSFSCGQAGHSARLVRHVAISSWRFRIVATGLFAPLFSSDTLIQGIMITA